MLGALFRSARPASPQPAAGLAERLATVGGGGAFGRELAGRVAEGLRQTEDDNFDHERWPPHAADEAAQYAQRASAACLADLLANGAQYEQARGLLCDAASRAWFMDLLVFRILGHRHVRLASNRPGHWELRRQAQAAPSEPSPFAGVFGPLRRFRFEFDGEPMAVDCWPANLAWTFFLRQYYFSRDGVSVRPETGDTLIDAGACFGDTALAFAASVGPTGRVHAYEIDPANLQVARHNFSQNPGLAARITLGESALSVQEGRLYRHGSGPSASVSSEPSAQPVAALTIDGLVARGEVGKVDFIKMDIEGAERYALAGARQTLQRYKPRLAISVFTHRPDDLWFILLWLAGLGLGYRFYLDHYTIHSEESILYAIA